jgi:hypothetical protein
VLCLTAEVLEGYIRRGSSGKLCNGNYLKRTDGEVFGGKAPQVNKILKIFTVFCHCLSQCFFGVRPK